MRYLLRAWSELESPVIGMVHLAALPGAPGHALALPALREQALRDATALAEGGVDGIMVENFHDHPFFPGPVPAITVAHMSVIARDLRVRVGLPLGINVLRNDGISALAVAHAADAAFLRVNVLAGARVTDQGLVQGSAHELLRERQRLGAESIRILADVDVKHSAPLAIRPLEEEAADLAERGGADGLVVSGSATAQPTSSSELERVRRAAPQLPVFVGSGVNERNIADLARLADGLIVGSSLKVDGRIDLRRVRALLAQRG